MKKTNKEIKRARIVEGKLSTLYKMYDNSVNDFQRDYIYKNIVVLLGEEN